MTGERRTYRSPKGTLLPAPDHIPSTHAPLRPTTTRQKRSWSSSYSIFACSLDTLFRDPRSTSTCVCAFSSLLPFVAALLALAALVALVVVVVEAGAVDEGGVQLTFVLAVERLWLRDRLGL